MRFISNVRVGALLVAAACDGAPVVSCGSDSASSGPNDGVDAASTVLVCNIGVIGLGSEAATDATGGNLHKYRRCR
jgi:hypothetical protein